MTILDILYSLVAGVAALLAYLLYIAMSNSVFFTILVAFIFLWRRLSVSRSLDDQERVSQPQKLRPRNLILNLLIEKRSGRVLVAECDKNLVDVLLSFLVLPLGKIIMVLDKKSGISSMDELYKSVEALATECFCTRACKSMLLQPRSAYGLECSNLAVKIDPSDYTEYYTCARTPCLFSFLGQGFVSLVGNSICGCGRAMDNRLHLNEADRNAPYAGGFVTCVQRFLVTDDLQIMPVSIGDTRSLLQRGRIRQSSDVFVKNVNIGLEEVLQLLRYSLLSKTPLTDTFQPNARIARTKLYDRLPETDQYWTSDHFVPKEMNVNLLFSKSTKEVVCAEANEDFIDFLFSLLTLPLGSIVKILPSSFYLGSIDNLYCSVRGLNSEGIVSWESTLMLLNPKLERMFGCENRLLEVDEDVTARGFLSTPNGHFLRIVNPKLLGSLPKRGGGFVRQQGRFLVTGSLLVEPLSPVASLKRLDIPFSNLEELSITLENLRYFYTKGLG